LKIINYSSSNKIPVYLSAKKLEVGKIQVKVLEGLLAQFGSETKQIIVIDYD